jgi:hypothetical protein
MKPRIIWLVCLLTLVPFSSFQIGYAKGLPKQAKKQVEERYKKSKMAVWGSDAGSFKEWGTVLVAVKGFPMRADRGGILGPGRTVTVDIEDGTIVKMNDYTNEVQPGTILGILAFKIRDDRIELFGRTAEPTHQVRRRAAIQQSFERTTTNLRFFFDEETMESSKLEDIYPAIDSWVKPFPTLEEAIDFAEKLGATKEISLGMTIAEVESVFGPPETRASLGKKVI